MIIRVKNGVYREPGEIFGMYGELGPDWYHECEVVKTEIQEDYTIYRVKCLSCTFKGDRGFLCDV